MKGILVERFPFDLAAIDLDGTLLGPSQAVSAENRAAVYRLQAAGVRVVLASGRWHGDILPFHRELGLSGYVVSSQGAVVKQGESGRTLQHYPLHDETSRRLVEAALQHGLTVICYRPHGVFANARTAWTEREEHCLHRRIGIARRLDTLCRDVLKVICGGPADRLARFSPDVAGLTWLGSDPEWFEYYHSAASKATAVARVAQACGVRASRVATFGDGDNDVPMLSWAGHGVAMAHGSAKAREAARCVAPSGEPETGLARAVAMLTQDRPRARQNGRLTLTRGNTTRGQRT